MSLKVIGAGFARTGTLSLKTALEQIGFGPCYHMVEVLARPSEDNHWLDGARGKSMDWRAIFDGFRSTVDWPSAVFWRELLHEYPEAKVVLTVRDDPLTWYRSFTETIFQRVQRDMDGEDPVRRHHCLMMKELVLERVFEGRIEDEQHAARIYQDNIIEVKDTVPRNRLLVFNVKEGWEPLCRFLDVPVPSEPFPCINTRDDFMARFMND